jgi:hypothetical protein
MAKYTIHYQCGHPEIEQLYGPEKERQRRIAWKEQHQVCPACYRAEQDQALAAETAWAHEQNADMPELKGSQAQIDWGERIRARAREHLALLIGSYMGDDPPKDEVLALSVRILAQDDATYWIARRADFEYADATARYCSRRLREERAKSDGLKAIEAARLR